jgi:2'-hydroxyisoflavone reductase
VEMPLWVHESNPDNAGFFAFDSSKAVRAGLTFRPLVDTIAGTLAWDAARHLDRAWRAGVSREREVELLEELKRR